MIMLVLYLCFVFSIISFHQLIPASVFIPLLWFLSHISNFAGAILARFITDHRFHYPREGSKYKSLNKRVVT